MCIGLWNRRFCNHWISRDAIVQYITTEAEDGRFSFPCPICRPKRCSRCVYHALSQREEGCCYISPKQIRSLLSEKQMERLLELQEKSFRTVNRDSIVQCPHPDCQYFYVLGPEDIAAADPSTGVLSRVHPLNCYRCRVVVVLSTPRASHRVSMQYPVEVTLFIIYIQLSFRVTMIVCECTPEPFSTTDFLAL